MVLIIIIIVDNFINIKGIVLKDIILFLFYASFSLNGILVEY
jgi:hypothetical protein